MDGSRTTTIMSSINTTTGTPTRGERASPKPSTTQQRVDEVLRRKAEAEKRVNERREALKQEQMNKLEKINAFREQERRERCRKNAEKELIRQKEALDRRQAQLEENQKKKEAILAKAHAATSRTANKENTKKTFAFGSSTPRELAYLQTLSKEAKIYDKRLRPEPLSPTRHRPSAAAGGASGSSAAATPSAMTTSVYVFSAARDARPAPRVFARIRSTMTSSAPSNNAVGGGAMTQSMHVSSTSSAFPHSQPRPARVARAPTGPTPTRAPRAAPTVTATERKREPPAARRTAAASSSPSPAGRALRSRGATTAGGVAAAGGRTAAHPAAPSPLTVAVNQEVSSSTSSLVQPVENTPPAPPSEDSDAGFSEGSYERAGSEKSTPVHGGVGGVEQTIEEELTPREEQPPAAIAVDEPVAVVEEVKEEATVPHEEEEEIIPEQLVTVTQQQESITTQDEELPTVPVVAVAAPLLSPPAALPSAVEAGAGVIELDYSAPLLDFPQTPVVEALLVLEEKNEQEEQEQIDLPEFPTVHQELQQQHTVATHEEVPEEQMATVPQDILEQLHTVSQELTSQQLPTVPQQEAATVPHVIIPEEEPVKTATVPATPEVIVASAEEITVAVPEERNLLMDFSDASVEEKMEEEDKTPLVEEMTPIGGQAMSLADELGQMMGGGGMKKEMEEESLIQIDKVTDVVPLIPSPPLIEDTVVNSLADELQQALGGVVEKKKEVEERKELPSPTPLFTSSSPTPSHEDEVRGGGGLSSAHPSTSSLPSGSSSGTESGESSPNTRRRRTEEKKAEMVKQSAILAMADSAAKERDERKARLAAIMNRTRAGAAAGPSGATSSTMTSSMSASMIGSTSGEGAQPSASASSVLAKIAHITSNPRIMQVAEKTGSSSDLRMGELPGAVPQY